MLKVNALIIQRLEIPVRVADRPKLCKSKPLN